MGVTDGDGKRIYVQPHLTEDELKIVWDCVFHGLGRSDVVKKFQTP